MLSFICCLFSSIFVASVLFGLCNLCFTPLFHKYIVSDLLGMGKQEEKVACIGINIDVLCTLDLEWCGSQSLNCTLYFKSKELGIRNVTCYMIDHFSFRNVYFVI